MESTSRTFKDVENGHICRLYTSKDRSVYHLIYEGQDEIIADGSEVNGFYLLAHTGGIIRLNNKKELKLNAGQFYSLKESERVTHVKYVGFSRFTKSKT
jgi:hypothetical protein